MKLLMLLLFVFTLAACNGETEEVDYPLDGEYSTTIESADFDGDSADISVSREGYVDDIEVLVTFTDGVITDFEVTNHSESDEWGAILISEGELQQAIIEQGSDFTDIALEDYTDLEDTDASGAATQTGESLIDIARAAYEHFEAYR